MLENARRAGALRMPREFSPARWLRESSSALVPIALVVGAGVGLGAVFFRWLIEAATKLFTGYGDYSDQGRVPHAHLPELGIWFLIGVPLIAGLLYGPLVSWLAPEARGHGVPEVMLAVAERGGRISPRVPVVKSLASAICIGGGGSVGREGPIVQIGSALGSGVGQLLHVGTPRMRLLVACGAAAGISATFNAPLAGPFFAMELILRDFAAESFGAVVLSSVTASIVGRALLGNHAFLALPSFSPRNALEYLFFALVGGIVGVVGVCFSKVLYLIEDVCDWLWRGPEWLRPAAGGVLLGGLLLALPEMYGVGYPVLQNAVQGHYVLWMLLLLLVGKMVATSLTIGVGGSGGVFAPTLFIGAMAGTACGQVVHHLLPGLTESPGAYGLIGMGAALGGATRAPITAVVILFELTGEYSIVVPLMAAVAIAAGLSHLLSKDTIYTRKLLRRGINIDKPPQTIVGELAVGSVAKDPPACIGEDAGLAELATLMAGKGQTAVAIVDDRDTYRGIVTAQSVAEALADPERAGATARQLAELPPTVIAADTVEYALDELVGRAGTGLPVLSDDHSRLVGWVTHEDIITGSARVGAT
jgi:CIC family chloride channel protein